MSKKAASPHISFSALCDGYEKAVANGFELSKAGMQMLEGNHYAAALGVSELGQEEIGKSLSLLAAFALQPVEEDWRWFWGAWKDHTVKAHRAFLYELIHPFRIEIGAPQGPAFGGLPVRERIALEKEAAFYVEYDRVAQRFSAPAEAVDRLEVFNRVVTLAYLAITAWHVKNALTASDSEFRLPAFGQLALRICTEEIFQEDMPAALMEFAAQSSAHGELYGALEVELDRAKAYVYGLFDRSNAEEPA